MLLAPIRLFRVCILHQSDCCIRVCILHQSECHFVLWFEGCSNFNEVMGDSERVDCDFVYVFDACRKWSCGVICVWPKMNSDTIVSMFIWFCYLEWMIYGGKLLWCDLKMSKIYQVEGTVLVLVCIFGLGPYFWFWSTFLSTK